MLVLIVILEIFILTGVYIMSAATDALTANVTKLSADVATLIAKFQAAPSEAVVQAQADAVAALDATVVPVIA
jgi:hypothetical protein